VVQLRGSRTGLWRGSADHERAEIDPQQAWCTLNKNICEFLDTLLQGQQFRVRGEDILASPDSTLRFIIDWLGLEANDDVTAAMQHPERSPYACFGPPSARYSAAARAPPTRWTHGLA